MAAPLRPKATATQRTLLARRSPARGGRIRPEAVRARGFTLIELLVTVAIIGILATIAYPNYSDYVIRGRLANVTNMLGGIRAQMEQYYQDNRTYAAAGTYTPPCLAITSVAEFSLACTIAADGSGYLMAATGSGTTAGFTYTVNQLNVQQTTAAPSGWSTSNTCWITSRGQSC